MLGAARQVVGRVGDLVGAVVDAVGRGGDAGHGLAQARHRAVEVGAQLGVAAGELAVDARGQVAGGQALQRFGEAVDDLGLLLLDGAALLVVRRAFAGLRLLRVLGGACGGLGFGDGALGGGVAGVQRPEHAVEVDGDADQHGGLEHENDRVDDHPPEAGGAREHRGRQDVAQQQVVHRHGRGGGDDGLPVAEHRQQREGGEVGHVHVDLPGMAGEGGDQDRHLRHQGHGQQDPQLRSVRQQLPGGRAGPRQGAPADRDGEPAAADGQAGARRHQGEQPQGADQEAGSRLTLLIEINEHDQASFEGMSAQSRAASPPSRSRAPERRASAASRAGSPWMTMMLCRPPTAAMSPAEAAAPAMRASDHQGG